MTRPLPSPVWLSGSLSAAENRARRWIQRQGLPASTYLDALTGDASDRRFIRVDAPGRPPSVLVVHREPIDPGTLPLIRTATLFQRLGIPLPAIQGVDAELGIVVLDDLGDITLEAAAAHAPAGEREALYREAIELIVTIQAGGRRLPPASHPPFTGVFDAATLRAELDFFVRHYVERYRGDTLTADHRDRLASEFHALTTEMAGEPRVLCHRDFHSRNLMHHRNRLYVIDWQDVRMGPDTYDLASLLRDAYLELQPVLVDRLIDHFCERAGVADRAALVRRFTRTAVQRLLKALGTFGYQMTVRGNLRYRDAVPRTVGYLERALASDARYARLNDLLAPLLGPGRS